MLHVILQVFAAINTVSVSKPLQNHGMADCYVAVPLYAYSQSRSPSA